MARYGMVIDLRKCIGCYGCMIACKAENCLPPQMFWGRVLIKEHGKYPSVKKLTVPVLCNHCTDAACVKVCPSGATTRREDGLVSVDYDKCIGCRYCMMACPYGARYFYDARKEYFPGQGFTPYEKVGHGRLPTGVVMKCTFCSHRIDAAVKNGSKPGRDREATPACVINCMANARHFGDLNDANSEVSHLVRERRGTQFHSEFGTDPSVYYLE